MDIKTRQYNHAGTVENMMQSLDQKDREIFVQALKEVLQREGIKSYSVGGYGQILGDISPLLFATPDQKVQAIMLVNHWNSQSENN